MKTYFTNKLSLKICCLSLLMGLIMSCDDFIEVDLPNNQLTANAVFQNNTTANAAMVNCYAQLRRAGVLSGLPIGCSNLLGNYTDELTFYGSPSLASSNFFNNTILASNPEVRNIWNHAYSQIYAANAIIEGLEVSSGVSATIKDQLTGEALFLRALMHHYLTSLFGEIPYILSTNYLENSRATKWTIDEIYNQLYADLELAIVKLPENYIDNLRLRPNKATAQMLWARVCLYNQDWEMAEELASAVIQNPVYVWENDLNLVFLKESKTTIWQLMGAAPGQNTDEGAYFIFLQGPPSNVALSETLMAAFETEDLRKDLWTNPVTQGDNVWHHAFKYKERIITPVALEYAIVFRLAETYLIRAEALANLGQLEQAVQDLNQIRNTAGLPNIVTTNQSALLQAIIKERQVELFTEHGHRFFDLKRTGNLDLVLDPIKPGWNSYNRLWPIPEMELLINNNLHPQNPGY